MAALSIRDSTGSSGTLVFRQSDIHFEYVVISYLQLANRHLHVVPPQIIIMAGIAVFYVAGYLIGERRRWPVIAASPRGQCSK